MTTLYTIPDELILSPRSTITRFLGADAVRHRQQDSFTAARMRCQVTHSPPVRGCNRLSNPRSDDRRISPDRTTRRQ
jgi:hypothetical protein